MVSEQQAYQRLSALCAQAEHCRKEMTDKMSRWQLPADVQEAVIGRLVKEKFIDEERYCRSFIRDKIVFNKWGRRKIEQALMMKRIPEEVFRAALDEVEPEEYISVLRPLIRSKLKTVTASSDYELAGKLMRFAAGRGFSIDEVRRVIDEMEQEEPGE